MLGLGQSAGPRGLLGLVLLCAACAEGLPDVPPRAEGQFAFSVDSGTDSAVVVMMEAPAPSDAMACDQAEEMLCPCPDGSSEGNMICLFDPSSPRDGFFGDCMGCPQAPAPTDAGVRDAGSTSDAGSPATDAGTADAAVGTPDAGQPDAGGVTPPPPMCVPAACPACPLLEVTCCTPANVCGCMALVLGTCA